MLKRPLSILLVVTFFYDDVFIFWGYTMDLRYKQVRDCTFVPSGQHANDTNI